MVRQAALALALVASAATAQSDFASRVTAAKISLDDAADRAFVEVWPSFEHQARELGISANSVRASTRWQLAGFSLGLCHAYTPATLTADWYGAFDRLALDGQIREHVHKLGSDELARGLKSGALDELTPSQKAAYCNVELEAIREVLEKF